MKNILCFGDSNTWGYIPFSGSRFNLSERWPGIMREKLGKNYWIIEDGLCGRTTVWDDPLNEGRNGRNYLLPCLEVHKPLDLVILMLGTNDLKSKFGLPMCDIVEGISLLTKLILSSETGRQGKAPKVLLIAPPKITSLKEFPDLFLGAEEKSILFSQCYKEVAQQLQCAFFDSGSVINSMLSDGIHFGSNEHRIFGEALAIKVKEIFDANLIHIRLITSKHQFIRKHNFKKIKEKKR